MLTKRKKQDIWLTQAQYDALQTLGDGVVYHITDTKVDYSTEVSNRPILKTDNTTAQTTSASETITGTINLHKVAKTGTYSDLLSKPTLGTAAAKDAGTQNGVADLDANGKVPFNELPLDAKTGASAPTTSTAADYVGQWYLDTSNNKTYQCTAITSDGATPPTYTYTWVQMIRITDTATTSDYGIVKIAQGRGLDFLGDGGLYVDVAGDAQITNRTIGRPIAAASLNFAVKSALSDANRLTMTSAEQGNALSVLGASQLVAKVELDTSANSITINNLDILADGGIYDFILKPKLAISGVGYPKITINGLSTGYSKSTIYTVAYSMGSANVMGYGAINEADFGIGNVSDKGTIIGQLTADGSVVHCQSIATAIDTSFNSMYINAGYVSALNVTSITFSILDKSFLAGTVVEIYKRATNAPTRS